MSPFLVAPKQAPKIDIPKSDSFVTVKIIDSIRLTIPTSFCVKPPYLGHELLDDLPSLVFLIEHNSSGRSLLFDLGVRKDFENAPPAVQKLSKLSQDFKLEVKQEIVDTLQENGIDAKGGAIEGIVWSHWHFDHTGNPEKFPSSTKLIVGSGFKGALMPGYPTNPESQLMDSYFAEREVDEITFGNLEIGGFKAHDYFGDGSFYLLDVPGHTIGHMCGLARVTTGAEEDTFILMGADACHHGGEFRPTEYLPLPSEVNLGPLHNHLATTICPGSHFEKLTPATERFYHVQEELAFDAVVAEQSIDKIEVFDAAQNIWVVIAHDGAVVEQGIGTELFPLSVNEWKSQGLKAKTQWRFLQDFKKAADAAEKKE